MDSIDDYIAVANTSSLDAFVAAYPRGLLLRRPQSAAGRGEIGFRTEYIAVGPRRSDPASNEWGIAPIAKRPANPFPDRITVGRATNCDIVIRVSFISKVHVHLLLVGDSMEVRDAGSANGSKLRGAPLGAQPLPIHDGDRLSLGTLELELVAAARAHALLQALSTSGATSKRGV